MNRPSRLGIITGHTAEARIARTTAAAVEAAGASPEKASRLAGALIGDGVNGLVSFGVAGGLHPDLVPGTVVIARQIMRPGAHPILTDRAWSDRLCDALPGSLLRSTGPLCGIDQPVADTDAKAELFGRTGAVAVDMESHAVAAVAANNGIPFIAVRAITDPADRNLPVAALAGLDGRVLPVLAALLRRPQDLGAMIGLAGDYRTALAALRRVALLAGPFLGFV